MPNKRASLTVFPAKRLRRSGAKRLAVVVVAALTEEERKAGPEVAGVGRADRMSAPGVERRVRAPQAEMGFIVLFWRNGRVVVAAGRAQAAETPRPALREMAGRASSQLWRATPAALEAAVVGSAQRSEQPVTAAEVAARRPPQTPAEEVVAITYLLAAPEEVAS